MKIKVTKHDRIFSQCIRERDDHTCQWCGRQDGTLACSHIYGRRGAGTRHHPLNAKTLCYSCHRRWHENPVEAFKWVEGYLGTANLDRLRRMAHSTCKLTKQDKVDIYEHYKRELVRLEGIRKGGATGPLVLEVPECLAIQ